MRLFPNHEALLKHLEKLAQFMREQGFTKPSEELINLLHDENWTTSSELLGELRLLFVRFLTPPHEVFPRSIEADLKNCIREIDKAFNS